MTPRAIGSAIEIWERWQLKGDTLPLDRIVNEEVRTRRYLNSRERRWVTDTLYLCVRLKTRQETICTTMGLPITPENLIRSTLLENDTEEGQQAYRQAVAQLPTPSEPSAYLRTTLSFPEFMAQELEAQFGEEAVAAGEALNTQAPTVLRINPLRTTRERVLQQIPTATPTTYSPYGVVLSKREPVQNLPYYKEGWFEVQEESSQLAVLFAGVKPDQTVVEVGAGGGGKSVALACEMRNRGKIFALDTSELRLNALEKRLPRACVKIVQAVTLKADPNGAWHNNPWLIGGRHAETADVVFLDAPCTGSGTLRRNPDKKWFGTEVAPYLPIQRTLIKQSSRLVKRGGRLCYVTCAFERAQNEEIVEEFLQSEEGAEFSLEALPPRLALFESNGYFRTWAHTHGLDAFFGARLIRKE